MHTSHKGHELEQEAIFNTPQRYDKCRPTLPQTFINFLLQLIETQEPNLVVDLGSGTGLSTRPWSNHARIVFGLEPDKAMIRFAHSQNRATNIKYYCACGNKTALPDACADIVVASQSFHWMEPKSTLVEVNRILRKGGVFAVIDYRWPVFVNWKLDLLEQDLLMKIQNASAELFEPSGIQIWPKIDHAQQMANCHFFQYMKSISFINVEWGNSERLMNLFFTHGNVNLLQKHGNTSVDLGIAEYMQAITDQMKTAEWPWYIFYDTHIGIK